MKIYKLKSKESFVIKQTLLNMYGENERVLCINEQVHAGKVGPSVFNRTFLGSSFVVGLFVFFFNKSASNLPNTFI